MHTSHVSPVPVSPVFSLRRLVRLVLWLDDRLVVRPVEAMNAWVAEWRRHRHQRAELARWLSVSASVRRSP